MKKESKITKLLIEGAFYMTLGNFQLAQKVITYFAGYNYYRVFNRYTVWSQKLFTFKTVRGTTFIVQTFIVCVTK